ncbi:Versicolorin B desaturase 1 [Colletotrichum truncatum]|uniref:Versicolorin B desaturase 1 n=1 Tax=Colletotrichum truncatum TaxID=5467 RepID=A0ACC3YZW2_COLTU|nr:Versicolorin B desaturase 1 [Colletotrichum truncatum]KAF6800866.1 Versicolorin B desaturase 1 [Colletotrichum truncatum]
MIISYKSLAIYTVAFTFVYYFLLGIYNVFFHPLRHCPGPLLWRASPLPKNIYMLRGTYAHKAREIHNKYKGTVRVAPNELSYIHLQAWKDILGRPLKNEMSKDMRYFGGDTFGRDSLVTTLPEDHTRMRRIFNSAFTNTALMAQEPLLVKYADQMIDSMGALVSRFGQVNLVDLFNFCTFDIMGDLTFGEPLHLLERGDYHPWVHNVFAGLKYVIYGVVLLEFPILGPLVKSVSARPLKKKAEGHQSFVGDLVNRRMEVKDHPKPDIWSFVLRRSGDEGKGLSYKEMHANATMFMVAGTETTATVLSGVSYHLMRNPRVYGLLTKEIRAAFSRTEDMTTDRLAKLEYLNAVLQEGLRIYNPAGAGMPRIVPNGGAEVCGEFVPGGTLVSVNLHVAFKHPDNWARPDEFVPERWLHPNDPEWKNDRRDVHEPFSYGPRNCIGRNLAWLELRLILAKTLWHFDMEMCPGMEGWVHQKAYITWEKGPLMAKLVPMKRQ